MTVTRYIFAVVVMVVVRCGNTGCWNRKCIQCFMGAIACSALSLEFNLATVKLSFWSVILILSFYTHIYFFVIYTILDLWSLNEHCNCFRPYTFIKRSKKSLIQQLYSVHFQLSIIENCTVSIWLALCSFFLR